MHAVGDCFDGNFRKHLPRCFSVLLGDAVDVRAETQCELRHVDGGAALRRFLQARKILPCLQDPFHQIGGRSVFQVQELRPIRKGARQIFHRKAVVTRGNRRVRGENALAANFLDVLSTDGRAPGFLGLFAEELQGEKRRVALVHVVARELVVAQRAQHAHSPDAQQYFLTKAIVGIASIKCAGEVAVSGGIRWEIGIEKIDRHFKTTHALHGVAPAAELDGAIFEGDVGPDGFFLQEIFNTPLHGLFRLRAIFG